MADAPAPAPEAVPSVYVAPLPQAKATVTSPPRAIQCCADERHSQGFASQDGDG
eukprot:COSAG01_NODE_620_length_14784_cov_49.916718_7_plen_54_part_00